MPKILQEIKNEENKLIGLIYYCPGCNGKHQIAIAPYQNQDGGSWTWNEDCEKPTFMPSVLIKIEATSPKDDKICHHFVMDGMIRYLRDCTHSLLGQTLKLVAFGV
jgi:hypothetical protein